MNVKVENVEKNMVRLEIELDAATFEDGVKKAYFKNVRKFNVPGFRKGKAPRNIIERYYGEQVFYEDAINEVFPEAYEKAVEENKLEPVERPSIDIKQIGKGENLVLTATVTVKPEVELGQYKAVEVEKKTVLVTEDDVEKEIASVADKNSRLVTVDDRAIQNGDTTVIDFEGFLDGVAFDGGKGEDYSLVIGSGHFIPGFEEQLVGVSAGADVDVNVTFPEDYQQKELAGKLANFKVKVKEIKVKEVPQIDDEFAKDVSEFDTLEEYKADIRKKLTEAAEHKAKHETEDEVIKEVVENAKVDVPDVMVENRIDSIVRDFDYRLRYQGLELAKYLEIMGRTMEEFRSEFKERAADEVKTQLVLEKVKTTEEITAGEEEIQAELAELAKNYNQDVEEFKKHVSADDMEYVTAMVTSRKTIDLLVESAKIVG
jgi:trigger factor